VPQDGSDLAEGAHHAGARDVQDGVEGRDSAEGAAGDVGGRQHLTPLEGILRAQPRGLPDHFRRKIDAARLCAAGVKLAGQLG
jgi:hypothetical protein